MHTREGIRRCIVDNGTKVSRFRSWKDAAESEKGGYCVSIFRLGIQIGLLS